MLFRFTASLLLSLGAFSQTIQPELPRVRVDTSALPEVTGISRAVHAGDNLQSAINAANLGDEIVLDAGATWSGNFMLPAKPGAGWITIRSSRAAELPRGTRVGPPDAPKLAKIVGIGPSQMVLRNDYSNANQSARAAHHYWFSGVELTQSATLGYYLIYLDTFEQKTGAVQTVDGIPHDITFDRCYIHRNEAAGPGTTHLLRASVDSFALIDSYLSHRINGPKYLGREGTGVLVIGARGPQKYENNFIEAESENIMFGGALGVPGATPSDIEIRRNYLRKDPAWNLETGCYKNLLEFKTGQRVLVDSNVLEHIWPSCAWNGPAITITERPGQSGAWTRVSDITLRNNIVRDVGQALMMQAADNYCAGFGLTADVQANTFTVPKSAISFTSGYETAYSVSLDGQGAFPITGVAYLDAAGAKTTLALATVIRYTLGGTVPDQAEVLISGTTPCRGDDGDQVRIAVTNNLFDGISARWAWQVSGGLPGEPSRHVVFSHNTVLPNPTIRLLWASRRSCTELPFADFEFVSNIFAGEIGADCGTKPALLFKGGVVSGNLHIGATLAEQASWLSFGGAIGFPVDIPSVGLNGDKTALLPSSPYYGKNVGADLSIESQVRKGTK